MTEETMTQALRWIRTGGEEGVKVIFFGGEPLLRWPLIKDTLEKYLFNFGMVTNATMLTDEIIDVMYQHKDFISPLLSIDGSPEENEKSRGKAYDPRLAKRIFGLPHSAARIVVSRPASLFDNVLYLVEELGCNRVTLNYRRHIDNDAEYYKEMNVQLKKIRGDSRMKRIVAVPGCNTRGRGCHAGEPDKAEIAILPNGDFYACDVGFWCGNWGYAGNVATGLKWDLLEKFIEEKKAMYAKEGVCSICAAEQRMALDTVKKNWQGEKEFMELEGGELRPPGDFEKVH